MTPSEVSLIVIDDVQAMRVQVKEILRACGFEKIRSASNGLEALRMMAEEVPHIVICDWHMAPMTGLELLKEMRTKAETKEIAFVMLTAEGTRERVMEAVKAGVDEYIMKPFTPDVARLKVIGALIKRKVF